MSGILAALFPLLSLLAAAETAPPQRLNLDKSRFRIQVTGFVLTDVPVKRIVIRALRPDGSVDTSYHDQPLISGIRRTTPRSDDAEIGAFRNGVLDLKTDLPTGHRVYITDSEIVVDPESSRHGVLEVARTQRWFTIVPPLIAVLLAVWLRNVIVSLFVAVWSGAVILAHGDFFVGFVRSLDTFLINELVQPNDPEHSHMLIVLFTMFLGALVGVMSRSGGTSAMIDKLARFTRTREQGQVMTLLLGLVVFFDDYANTLLVGGAMRPVTDRLRISREKLAFLIDSTAAPVAGLALVSTWVGVEIGYIQKGFDVAGIEGSAYTTFLASIPFRFYSLHLLVFVMLIAFSGHDFGPMLRAEGRALAHEQIYRPGATVSHGEDESLSSSLARRKLLRNALIPIVVLLILVVAGMWWSGASNLGVTNARLLVLGRPAVATTFWNILNAASPNRVLFLSSFVASAVAVAMAVLSKSLTLIESTDAWFAGAKSMMLGIVVLVLAWAIATLCDDEHLNTAGFLIELALGRVSVNWMPTLAFLLAAAISFATGSSFATMGLLMPLSISITFHLLVGLNEAHDANHQLILATVGAILAGAIFGDHCSPISDTTVLSSTAAGSDHLDHVTTQLPYAASVAAVAVLLGYLPSGFGFSPIVLLPLGLIVLYALVLFLGRPVQQYADSLGGGLSDAELSASFDETDDDAATDDDPTDAAAPAD